MSAVCTCSSNNGSECDLLTRAMGCSAGLPSLGVTLKAESIANYACPMCDHSTLPRVNGTASRFQCGECGTEVTEVRK